jgi:hypothetical protein
MPQCSAEKGLRGTNSDGKDRFRRDARNWCLHDTRCELQPPSTRSLCKKPCLNDVDEGNDLSRIASCEPRLQLDPSTPPALDPELLKSLSSTLNQPPQRLAKMRPPSTNAWWKSLGPAGCTQVVAAEKRIRNGIKRRSFPVKMKSRTFLLTLQASQPWGVFCR